MRTQCPTCAVVEKHGAKARIPDGTRVEMVLVQGLLGFGWEWDGPRALLDRTPGIDYRVFKWSMGDSLVGVAGELARQVDALMAAAPPEVERFVVVGHSVGGMIAARAAARLHVPAGRSVWVVSVGAPYAGMNTTPFDTGADFVHSPLIFSVGGRFTRAAWPPPAPGVTLESWVTSWPGDPVMKPRFGHDPGDPRTAPTGARQLLPPGSDHNDVLSRVISDVLKRLHPE